ncbi:bifunctional alpha,alpha-trehalose-phosphate synthase (UDP-forming)/trehalose-phosphatase [Deinococcus sonorensis]|uniref:Bifunctional alpha,alpha-trehalose-phosphate synthase (UDP-forming)/trehalose-phosphatase n=2 Tax=Deinococcus sonorensis TaxID=309891 RepID=A0AAU7UFJ0_9DEIO
MSLIVVSNREPYSPRVLDGGQVAWLPSIGGLTSALDPVMQRMGGSWIAWGEQFPGVGRVQLPVTNPRYTVERLVLSSEEVDAYYYGFSNRALWPMCHYFIERARYLQSNWEAYRDVNERFADAAARQYHPGDLIWVHDYQLALVPGQLRERLPDARIGMFWHIPWPAQDVFRTLPWDAQILKGMLGADLIGMHTPSYVRHFLSACESVLGLEVGRNTVVWEGRTVQVQSRPIGIETATFEELAASPEVETLSSRIRQGLQTMMLLGVDRLDYTKGIPERLEAFDAFLDAYPDLRGRVTLVQIAVPSREEVESYAQLRSQVEGLVGRINGKHAQNGWTPIHYVYRGLSREELVAHYRAADVMLVTPLRDGLNLVAKEFAASSRDGVLLLSRFAGAASELPEALHVNPYDHDGLAQAIHAALHLPLDEKQLRLKQLRERLEHDDLGRWTEAFLHELSLPDTLPDALLQLGQQPLLILCDYDGTIAPISRLPRDADPQPGAWEAFSRLLHHRQRRVAIVTGRRSVQVYGFLPLPDLPVVGLHGMEWPDRSAPAPDRAAIASLAQQLPSAHGLRIEDKRWTLAVHYRNVAPGEQAEVEARLRAVRLPAGWELIEGKKVVEYRPGGYGKGRAVQQLVEQHPGYLPVFIGDDATDEEAFAVMKELGGVSIKVGAGPTLAPYRLANPAAVVELLRAWAGSAPVDPPTEVVKEAASRSG